MPELDDCQCTALIVSSGLMPGHSWPACAPNHDISIGNPVAGKCNHPPDCPEEDARRCEFTLTTDFTNHTCPGLGITLQERDIGDPDWEDLGIETTIPKEPWSIVLRPQCGKERKIKVLYAGASIWEAVVRCSNCTAAN
ncbi:MAG: hypothetical protein RL885_25155 [Planctomycetota bacterium]